MARSVYWSKPHSLSFLISPANVSPPGAHLAPSYIGCMEAPAPSYIGCTDAQRLHTPNVGEAAPPYTQFMEELAPPYT